MQEGRNTAVRDRLLWVVALVAIGSALKAAYPVAMPVAFAAVVVAAVWPLEAWLERWMPSWASYFLSVLLLAALFLSFLGAVYLSAGQLVEAISAHADEIDQAERALGGLAARWGLPIDDGLGSKRLIGMAGVLASHLYSIATFSGFIALLVALGLADVARIRANLFGGLADEARHQLRDTLGTISRQIRRYFATTGATSLLTGVASALWALGTGLDMAAVWGVLNFLLNFVPVVGNVVGIIPPSLYALIQFHNPLMALLVFVGFAVLQTVISNVVFPMFAGRQLSLSPLAIVVSMSFWSWLWGIAGALIAVPLTSAATIALRQFDRTVWIARLLSA